MYICPKCGAPEGSRKFIGPFCIDCATFRIEVPDKLEVHRCKRCPKTLLRGKWVAVSDEKLSDYVISKFKGDFSSVAFDPGTGEAVFLIERDGERIEVKKLINFVILNDICPDCNRQAGGYFEAIIQLRGNEQRVTRYLHVFKERLESEGTFISKFVELKEGLDLYVGSTGRSFR